MKKIKRLMSFLAGIVIVSSILPFSSCNSEQVLGTETIVVNGYEKYQDLSFTTMRGWAQGKIELNTDKQYITEGNSSASFFLKQDNDCLESLIWSRQEYPWISFFKYETSLYPNLRWIDQIKTFSFDIYNDSNLDYEVYLSAIGDAGYVYSSDGAVLVANSWNSVNFELKPWFFEKDTYVKEYAFYIVGIEESAQLYIDNVRIEKYDGNAPKYTETFDPTFEEQELLTFATEKDVQFIQTECGIRGDVGEVISLLDVSYNPTVQVGNLYGAMQVNFNRCLLKGWSWAEDGAYALRVDPRILTNTQKAKSFEIRCFNPNQRAHVVTLEVEGGVRIASKRVRIDAMKTEKIQVSNLLGLSRVDNVYIRIDGWDVTSMQTLYFSGLYFTV